MTESVPDKNSVTVVIPARDAGQRFADLLDSLQKQTIKPAQILVIDSESTDETLELAKSRNCEVITINRSDFDHGTTRNLGVAQTNSKFVVFLTQDALPYDECTLENIVRPALAANIKYKS